MRNLPSIIASFDAPISGFSDGRIRDNPGDLSGSGVVAAWGNDLWYALRAIIKKYATTGDVSDTAESENNHDVLNALELMMGLSVDGVADWNSATTYSTAGESVNLYGIQFVNINATGNLNKSPLTETSYWLPADDAKSLLLMSAHGRVQWNGSHPIHDYNNASYMQYFGMGTHRVGGYSGVTYKAYGVHLDGSAVGISGTPLSDIVESWHLKDIWMPGSLGARTLVDARGHVSRAIDETGGQADLMGEVLADQMQGWQLGGSKSKTYFSYLLTDDTREANNAEANTGLQRMSTTAQGHANAVGPKNDGTNGDIRSGLFTRDKSVTSGVPYVVIMVPA